MAFVDQVGTNQTGYGLCCDGVNLPLSIFLACACHQTATSQALLSCYLGGGRARSDLLGSEVFLPAVQSGFGTSHAVTGSETKETTTTTPTTTADTSTAAAAAATSPLDPGH